MVHLKASVRRHPRTPSLGRQHACTSKRELCFAPQGLTRKQALSDSRKWSGMALLGSLGTPGADFLRAPDKVGDHLFFMVCAPHPPTLLLLLQSKCWSHSHAHGTWGGGRWCGQWVGERRSAARLLAFISQLLRDSLWVLKKVRSGLLVLVSSLIRQG